MQRAVRFHEHGGPEVLRLEEVEVGEPGPGEARVRHAAVGVNFADVYVRTGLFPASPPTGIGVEASGVVEAVGEGVETIRPGDRVAYVGGPLGAYSSARVMPASWLTPLPDAIDLETAAGMMMRGFAAAYLATRMWPTRPGDVVLVQAAAGGVGHLLCQWAKLLGLSVIGTVSSEAKAEKALSYGCEHVLRSDREDVAGRVRLLTGGQGVAVAFDGVGRSSFMASIACVRRRGLFVPYGSASGPPPPLELAQLAVHGSLYLTRPTHADFAADPTERAALLAELFDQVASGRIRVEVNQRYPLEDAARAHADLQARRTTGSTILVV